MSLTDKQDKDKKADIKCPFCGRRKVLKKIEDDLYWCDHCQKAFSTKT